MGGAVSSFVDFIGVAFEETVTFRDLGVFRILDGDKDLFRVKLVNEFAKWIKYRNGNPISRLIYEKIMLMSYGRIKALGFTASVNGTIKTITVKNIEELLSAKYNKTINVKKKSESIEKYNCVCSDYRIYFSNIYLTAEQICQYSNGEYIDSSLTTKWFKKSCVAGINADDLCPGTKCEYLGQDGRKYIIEINKIDYYSDYVKSYLHFFVNNFESYRYNIIDKFDPIVAKEDLGIFVYEKSVFPFFYDDQPLIIKTDDSDFIFVNRDISTYYFYNIKNKATESITIEENTDTITLSDDRSYKVLSVKVNDKETTDFYTTGMFPVIVNFNDEIEENSNVEIEYEFVDLNKTDNEISINIPVNKSAIACVCLDHDDNEFNEVFYQEEALESIGVDDFMFIPLKQRGALVNTKHKYNRLLKDMGIDPDILIDGSDESDGIGSEAIKEAIITIGTNFGDGFDEILNILYGKTNKEFKSITIGDGITDLVFFNDENCYPDTTHDSDDGEYPIICNSTRKMSIKIGDNSYYTNHNYDNGIFPIPMKYFKTKSRSLKDFYGNYKHDVVMFVYAKDSVKLKFWQTSMFQFLTFAIGFYFAPVTTFVTFTSTSLFNNAGLDDNTKLYMQIAVIAYQAYSFSGPIALTITNYALSAEKIYLLISQYKISNEIEEYNKKTEEIQNEIEKMNNGIRIYMPFENIDEYYKVSTGEYDYNYDRFFEF